MNLDSSIDEELKELDNDFLSSSSSEEKNIGAFDIVKEKEA